MTRAIRFLIYARAVQGGGSHLHAGKPLMHVFGRLSF
jgi:hypothetical protein